MTTLPKWRSVATRVDLLRSTGARHAWRRWQCDRTLRRLEPARRAALARTTWSEAASELGATVTELAPGQLEIRRGDEVVTVAGQVTRLNRPEAVALANDKPAAYAALLRAGVPVPEHLAFESGDLEPAKAFLTRGPVPCVVKPAAGRGGDGVTGGVRTTAELRRAALSASRFASRLLVERQVTGDVFRLLVLDGEVVDVLRRRPPRIEGDGESTVEELIFAEYHRRLGTNGSAGLKPFAVDLDCLLTLAGAGLSLRSVPAPGAIVPVKTVTNYNRHDENEPVGAVSDGLKAQAVAAGRALGLRLVGVDVVTASAESSGIVVDLNAAPALHHHGYVADGATATRVAVPILRTLLEEAAR
jgi:D-alanine-D-alanine ligase-like ATP-grasp enzyme